jgi:murein DD-endopeptidase MepM/ murein hydrolase activator NlpD
VLLAGCGLTSPRPEPGPRPAGPTVEVGRNDTIYEIADRYGVPLSDLIELNRLRPPYTLSAGQQLVLPSTREYVVQPDDTLSEVAERFRVSTTELARANSLDPPYTIYAGQALRLPAGADVPPQPVDPRVAADPGPAALGPQPPSGPQPSRRPVGAPVPLTPPDRTVEVEALPPLDGVEEPEGRIERDAEAVEEEAGEEAAAAPPVPPRPPAPAEPRTPAAPEVAAAPPPPGGFSVDRARPPAPDDSEETGTAGAPPPRAGFRWPLQGPLLAGYGPADDGAHNDGINIGAAIGAPIVAADNGVVAYAGNELRGYGNLLLIRHADGWVTAYAHTDRILVERGERVRAGQTIATVGTSGAVSEPQLHFEIRRGSDSVNPLDHLP